MCHLMLLRVFFKKIIECLHVSFDAAQFFNKMIKCMHVSFDAAEVFKEFVFLQTPIE